MKNSSKRIWILAIALVLMLALSVAMLTACGNKGQSNQPQSDDAPGGDVTPEDLTDIFNDKLKPKFDDENTVSWDKVTDATSYIVTIGNDEYETDKLSFNMEEYNPNRYEVIVTAVNDDFLSEDRITVDKRTLKSPDVEIDFDLDTKEYTIQIEQVTSADGYTIKIGGQTLETDQSEYVIPINASYFVSDVTKFTVNATTTNKRYKASKSTKEYQVEKLVSFNLATDLELEGGEIPVKMYAFEETKVVYNYNFGNNPQVVEQVVKKDEQMNVYEIPQPEREGYLFVGWFTDPACKNPYSFDSRIKLSGTINLYADWFKKPNDYVDLTEYTADNPYRATINYSNGPIRFYVVGDNYGGLAPTLHFMQDGNWPTTKLSLIDLKTDEVALTTTFSGVSYSHFSLNAGTMFGSQGHIYRYEFVGDDDRAWSIGYDIALYLDDSRRRVSFPSAESSAKYLEKTLQESTVLTKAGVVAESAPIVGYKLEGLYVDGVKVENNIVSSRLEGKTVTAKYVASTNRNTYSGASLTRCNDPSEEICEYNVANGKLVPITTIGDSAFSGSIKSITISDYITNISSSAFSNCNDLKEIKVGANNSQYSSLDGILYDKQKTKIICVPRAIQGAITIPDSVTTIGNGAFRGCTGLTSVTIGNGVTSIGDDAFYGCDNLQYNEYGNAYYLGNETNPYVVLIRATNKDITSFTINDNCKIISSFAFRGCTGLTSVTIGNGVTSIGDYAFKDCTSLRSITIPNSVTSIGSYIFSGCPIRTATIPAIAIPYLQKTLKTVVITSGENIYGFSGYTSLTSITIPDSVTSIGDYAFKDCTGLTSITIPDSVTSIGGCAFQSCTGLTSITIGKSVTSIGSIAFPTFSGCYKLVEVYNKSSLTITAGTGYSYVGYYAKNVYTEAGGSKLSTDANGYVIYTDGADKILVAYTGNSTNLTLPSNITEIYKYAFYNMSGLTSITIPNSVISIGDYAFKDCTSLTSITIPNSVTSIGLGAFANCTGLTSITVDSGNTVYDSRNNCNAIIETESNTLIVGTKNTIIPNSVTSIGNCAFYECRSLTSIKIPNSVTSIGNCAFYRCGLTSVTIGNGVTSIGDSAFQRCGLTSVTIGNGVTSIGDFAFEYCYNLKSVTIPNSVTSIGDCAFQSCMGLTSVTIGNGVTSIGDRAFYYCTGLQSKSIKFEGTISQWNAISKGNGWNAMSSHTIHCADGDIG